jgi:toxin FitB
MKWLLDTCVISELISLRPQQHVIDWIDAIQPDSAYLSVITIGEIYKGMERLPHSKRRETIRGWLEEDLLLRFRGKIVPIDVNVVTTWGKLTGRLEKDGRKMAALDSLIAASALHGDFTLVTRNIDDFMFTGVSIHNPWQ